MTYKSRTKRFQSWLSNLAGNIGSAPERAFYGAKGYIADTRRGLILSKEGYRPSKKNYTDSSAKMANRGKRNLRYKRPSRK